MLSSGPRCGSYAPQQATRRAVIRVSRIQASAATAARRGEGHVSHGRPCRSRKACSLRPSASAAQSQVVAATNQLPRSPLAMVEQAAAAVQEALAAGKSRQQLVLLLPVNEKEANFMNTEATDYPCSVEKEFDTASALVTSVLQKVLGANVNINSKRIDDGGVEGDPCAVLFPDDKSLAAVVCPTADRLKNIQAYAKEAGRTVLIVNPQWNNSGQVISDFGFGPWRKAADDFLGTFEPTFVLKEKRIGSPGTISGATGTRFVSGGVLRLLRRYPGSYEVYAMAADGSNQLLGVEEKEPTYQEMDALIKAGRQKKLEIFDIAKRVTYVYQDGSEADEAAMQPGGGVAPGAATAAAGEGGEPALGSLTDANIEAMDGATLRRQLTSLGLPTSGKMSKLRERLREARDAA